MKDYSAMSDEEISKEVGDNLGLEWANLDANYNKLCYWKMGAGPLVFDPCNKPADAWPIIFRERITLTPKVTGYEWDAISPVILNDDIEHLHTGPNPLRSAMIVFLMMKDRESSHA
ncbi:phage protein NinX family protein [Yersinia intermedia]|uniref:DUF2591 domain-containing protein n=1 Tax=Yersinia intermedia TaxID=631 RepID=A0ABX6F5J5_YERIN|nr:phage protein NinX family protein [Yersinia intermedia]QGR65287.1 DUF2591 domain-containing protein [Yersinia intermedia]QGR70304.1 DUF2591 domain-containing protein [Yersinia intermedia]